MKQLFPFFRLFWVACCAATLLVQTRLLLGLPVAPGYLDGFVFGGTVFGYHCTHPNPHCRRLAWLAGVGGGLCLLAMWAAPAQSLEKQAAVFMPVLFWLAYYGFQKPGNAGLRSHWVAKPVTVALTWAWVTVVLPVEPSAWSGILLVFLGRAAFVFALALAYDLIDAEYDHGQGLRTLTGQLGLKGSMLLIYKILVLAGLCVCGNVAWQVYTLAQGLGLLVSLIASAAGLRWLLRQGGAGAWYKPFVDGLMVLQFLLVLLFSAFQR